MLNVDRSIINECSASLCISHDVRESRDASRRGGDFFAYVRQGDGCVTIAVGDASAKAGEGYHHAHVLKRAFRMAALGQAQPSDILDIMSRAFLEKMHLTSPTEKFASAFIGRIDTKARRLLYASAGVEGGMVFRCLTSHEHLAATGPLLGMEERPNYTEGSIAFYPGNILVAYTDGVTEARSARDARFLGTHGLAKLVRRTLEVSLAPGYGNLFRQLDRFAGGVYNDDATLISVTAVEANQV